MKVHQRQRAFLTDQRSTRLMQIGGVDKVTAMMERRKSREERMTERQDEEKRRKLNIEQTDTRQR